MVSHGKYRMVMALGEETKHVKRELDHGRDERKRKDGNKRTLESKDLVLIQATWLKFNNGNSELDFE